ncbi:MAG TPA: GAF and ANTAR domain-containing protein [Actinomycetota bacterium]|nr:GAF and ANTAR domain-containing protein [Actinomycetota bacterium]
MGEERRLAKTLVELADTLVADFDIVDFLHTLAQRCVELIDAAEAGLMLADQRGGLRMVASSSERARLLELFEIQNEQGPCLDCFKTGQPVSEEDLEAHPDRWPLFAAEAKTAGFRSVHALPMRCRSQVIGALNLFRTESGPLDDAAVHTGQAMADIATIGILQERAVREARVLAEQLQSALNSRVVIEQAKGVLAERASVNVDDAFQMLRTYARNNNRRLHEVAEDVIGGAISTNALTKVPPPSRQPKKG